MKNHICIWRLLLSGIVCAFLFVACKNSARDAEHVAETFLQAYYMDLDFDKAISLCTEDSKEAIREQAKMVSLNPYAKEELPELTFTGVSEEESSSDNAVFSYQKNRAERTLPLIRLDGRWLVDLQGGTVEMCGENDMLDLSSFGSAGFASSESSGEIKYKPRKSRKRN